VTSNVGAEPVVKQWKIPVLVPLTGSAGGFGTQMKWGMEYAAQEINAAGGIAGRPVELEFYDDANDPAKAVAEMSKVVKDALVLLGPQWISSTKGAGSLAVRYKVLFTSIAGDIVADQFKPYVVHFGPRYKHCVPPTVKGWLKLNSDIKTVVQFVWPQEETWIGFADTEKKALEEAGVKVIARVECTEGLDFGSAVIRAMSYKPDGFTLDLGPVEMVSILKELNKRGWNDRRKIIGIWAMNNPHFYDLGKGFIDGCYHWDLLNGLSTRPKWLKLKERFKQDFPDLPEPIILVAPCYDEVYFMKMVIENTGATGDPAKLGEERSKIVAYSQNIKQFPAILDDQSIIEGNVSGKGYLFQMVNNRRAFIGAFGESGF
jgi:branched-chain amino acid transport system substrate-binding protein